MVCTVLRGKIAVKALHITLRFDIRKGCAGHRFFQTDRTVLFCNKVCHGFSAGTGTIGHRGTKPVNRFSLQGAAGDSCRVGDAILFVISLQRNAQLLGNRLSAVAQGCIQGLSGQRGRHFHFKGHIFHRCSVTHLCVHHQSRGIKFLSLHIKHIVRFMGKNQLCHPGGCLRRRFRCSRG